MSSPILYAVDDNDLDDAALWAVIDSAAAASLSASSSSTTTISAKTRVKPLTPIPFPIASPQAKLPNHPSNHRLNYNHHPDGEVVQNHRPHKISRTSSESSPSQLLMVKHVPRTPTTPPTSYITESPETRNLAVRNFCSPNVSEVNYEETGMRHSLAGQFPSVSLFKEYQNAAMAGVYHDMYVQTSKRFRNGQSIIRLTINTVLVTGTILEKNDYTMISGHPYIKKSGWRKISFYFNLSYEIKDKTIEFDENRNVQRAEFVIRAYMQGGRFSDGWGSCERREKKFLKPNHDIPSTAETRAKNKACQDLLGIGEYRPGTGHT